MWYKITSSQNLSYQTSNFETGSHPFNFINMDINNESAFEVFCFFFNTEKKIVIKLRFAL